MRFKPEHGGFRKDGLDSFRPRRDRFDYRDEDRPGTEARFQSWFEKSLDAVFLVEKSTGRILKANNAAQTLVWRPLEDLTTLTVHDLFSEKISELAAEADGLESGLEVGDIGFGWPDGTRRSAQGQVIDLDEDALFLILRDITEQKKAGEALRASEERYRIVIETSSDAICFNRIPDGRYFFVNQAFLDLGGYRLDEVIGKTTTDLGIWWSEEERKSFLAAVDQNRLVLNRETRFRGRNDRVVWGLVNAQTLVYEGEPLVLSITRDITAVKEAQAEKKALEDRMVQTQKMEALGTLAGGIAHDFNNILAAILGNAELALLGLDSDSSLRSKLEAIRDSSDRARKLVRQILSFSLRDKPMRTPVRMDLIVKETLKLLRSSIPSGIDIRVTLDSRAVVLGDPIGLHQMLMNLCTNAFHAMEKSGGTLAVGLWETREGEHLPPDLPAGTYVKLVVKDDGEGIDPFHLDRIFDPYFSTKERDKGTGLGLAATLGIVKNHGGTMVVESHPGTGSRFQVLLPRSDLDPQVEKSVSNLIREGTERIMLVDDDPEVLAVVQEILEKLGYLVSPFSDPRQALQVFERSPRNYNLVLTDLTMPEMTGDRLIEKLKVIRPDISTVMVSGFSEQVDKHRALELGLDAFIMKPLKISEISRTIRGILDRNLDP